MPNVSKYVILFPTFVFRVSSFCRWMRESVVYWWCILSCSFFHLLILPCGFRVYSMIRRHCLSFDIFPWTERQSRNVRMSFWPTAIVTKFSGEICNFSLSPVPFLQDNAILPVCSSFNPSVYPRCFYTPSLHTHTHTHPHPHTHTTSLRPPISFVRFHHDFFY